MHPHAAHTLLAQRAVLLLLLPPLCLQPASRVPREQVVCTPTTQARAHTPTHNKVKPSCKVVVLVGLKGLKGLRERLCVGHKYSIEAGRGGQHRAAQLNHKRGDPSTTHTTRHMTTESKSSTRRVHSHTVDCCGTHNTDNVHLTSLLLYVHTQRGALAAHTQLLGVCWLSSATHHTKSGKQQQGAAAILEGQRATQQQHHQESIIQANAHPTHTHHSHNKPTAVVVGASYARAPVIHQHTPTTARAVLFLLQLISPT